MSQGSLIPYDYIDRIAVTKFSGDPLTSPFAMEGKVSGHHRSNHKGSSVEFAEYREYTSGEDPRRLDWRVMARTDRLYLKEFEAETNLRCHFGLDCSRSMNFGEKTSKFEFGKRIVATLAYLLLGQGDAVGLDLLGSSKPDCMDAKRSPSQLRTILEILHRSKARGKSNFVQSIHHLADSSKRRAMLIIVSDFLEDPMAILKAIHHCRERKHDVVLMQVLDRQEMDFSFVRPTRFVDLEGGPSLLTDPNVIREEYLKQFKEHLAILRKGCLETQSSFFSISTEVSLSDGLNPFISARKSSPPR